MPLPQFVIRRGQQLYYRRAYPKELWPVTGKAAFAMSLRTADPAQALRARPAAERRYTQLVDEPRAELARQRSLPPLTNADAEALAVRWFLQTLADLEEDRRGLSPDELEDAREAALEEAAEDRRKLAEGELRWQLARKLRDRAGFSGETSADRALARLLGRASVAVSEVERGRLAGRYGCRPSDPLFASAMDAPPPAMAAPTPSSGVPPVAQSRTISDLIKSYQEARGCGAAG